MQQYTANEKKLTQIYNKISIVDNDCWQWNGYMNGPTPTIYLDNKRVNVKIVLYVTSNPDLFTEWNDTAYLTSINICGDNFCCNPDHFLVKGTEPYFWYNVDIKDDDECWEWKGAANAQGYGDFVRNGSGKNEGVHRLAHMYHYRTDNSAEVIMHKCDNRLCCNPHHLEAGNDLLNMRDKIDKGRHSDLRPEDVVQVKEMLIDSNLTTEEIAKKMKISKNIVYDIARGKTWARPEYDTLSDGRSFEIEMRMKHTLKEGERMVLYALMNTVTERVYVGRTVNIDTRLKGHKSTLSTGSKKSPDEMISDYRKYGWDSFSLIKSVEIDKCNYMEAEEIFIAEYDCMGYELYNQQSVKPKSNRTGTIYVLYEEFEPETYDGVAVIMSDWKQEILYNSGDFDMDYNKALKYAKTMCNEVFRSSTVNHFIMDRDEGYKLYNTEHI